MGDLLRPIRLNAAARGVVKDSGGGEFHCVLAFGAGQRKATTHSGRGPRVQTVEAACDLFVQAMRAGPS